MLREIPDWKDRGLGEELVVKLCKEEEMKRAFLMSITILLVAGLAMPVLGKGKGSTRFGDKGVITLAGNVAYTSASAEVDVDGNSSDLGSQSTLNFSPVIGYFVMNNLSVGVGPTYTSSKSEDADGNELGDSSTSGAKLSVDYYYPLGGTLFVDVGARVGYMTASEGDNDSSGLGFGAFGGVALAFGGKYGGFGTFGLFYDRQSMTVDADGDPTTTTSSFGVASGLGLFF